MSSRYVNNMIQSRARCRLVFSIPAYCVILDGDVPSSTSYISQLISFARASSYVADYNTRNKLTC